MKNIYEVFIELSRAKMYNLDWPLQSQAYLPLQSQAYLETTPHFLKPAPSILTQFKILK